MKLEIKHLAPYLPYGIEMRYNKSGYPDVKMTNLNVPGFENGINFKPILRPLSDLTKEITHNWERFIPATVLWDYNPNSNDMDDLINQDWIKSMGTVDIKNMEYQTVEKLFEWHFDVFGLIEQGLAIEIK